ncbi:MAG: LuxR C-terminal-related transcriptional regulator [Terriglobales bacterium]
MASRFWPRFGFPATRKGRHPSWQPLSRTLVRNRPSRRERVRRASGSEGAAPPLNSREMDVLRLVVQGLSNKEIASSMNISESAVKNTLQQLFGKTEVRTRSQLVRVALELSFDVPASCICGGRTSIVGADRFRTANGTAICCSFSIGS